MLYMAKEVMFIGAIAGKKLPAVSKHPLLGSDALIVGYTGKKGCFSFRGTGRGTVDVAIYSDCCPETLTEADILHPVYREIPVRLGWGFVAIAELKAAMA